MTDFGPVALDGQLELDSYGEISAAVFAHPPIAWDGQLDSYLGRSVIGGQILRGIVCAEMLENFMFLAQYTSLLQSVRSRQSGRDDTVGNTTPPSQRQGAVGILRHLLIPVTPGVRAITVDVLFSAPGSVNRPSPFPRMTVKANPEVGLHADVVAQAVDSETWQALSATFTATAVGVVEVWREKRCIGMDDTVWWDNLTVS